MKRSGLSLEELRRKQREHKLAKSWLGFCVKASARHQKRLKSESPTASGCWPKRAAQAETLVRSLERSLLRSWTESYNTGQVAEILPSGRWVQERWNAGTRPQESIHEDARQCCLLDAPPGAVMKNRCPDCKARRDPLFGTCGTCAGRGGFLVHAMSFKERFVAPILAGSKTFTLRPPNERTARIVPGDQINAFCRFGPPFARLRVERVIEPYKLGDLSLADLHAEGLASFEDAAAEWRRMYREEWSADRAVVRIDFTLTNAG